MSPYCIVSPTSAEDVSIAIKTLTGPKSGCNLKSQQVQGCKFAVRSGGHMVQPGAANIEDGVTIDLRGLNDTNVNEDKTTAHVGPGAIWVDVYIELEKLGLAVVGGRSATVGVGGLTTGGGMSFLSPRYGWTCDTVSNFQVVLASGEIVNANIEENADLLVALRGGSNNFGIVTKVDMNTYEQGPFLGGEIYCNIDTAEQQLKAFHEVNSADDYDEHASLIITLGYASGLGRIIINIAAYTKAERHPAVFEDLMAIPSISDTMHIANMSEHASGVAKQAGITAGARQFWTTLTHGSSLAMLESIFRHWNNSVSEIEDVHGIAWALSLEPLPPAIYSKFANSNSLGFTNKSKPLVVTMLSASWADEADDTHARETAQKMLANMEADARKLDEYDPFVYLNYAEPLQEPILSYGSESVENLRRVRERVDPNGVFTHRVPGGFKIPE